MRLLSPSIFLASVFLSVVPIPGLAQAPQEDPMKAVSVMGQIESSVEEFNGVPLVTANWIGTLRPYLFKDGKFVPLIPDTLENHLENLELWSATSISSHEVLMTGRQDGSSIAQMYLFDSTTGKLTNLTNSPKTSDWGFCVSKRTPPLIAYSNDGTHFAEMREGKRIDVPLNEKITFSRCLWLDYDHVIGMEKDTIAHLCAFQKSGIECRKIPAFDKIDKAVNLFEGPHHEPGVIARLHKKQFFRPYMISKDLTALNEIQTVKGFQGDVLQILGKHIRVSKESRYWVNGMKGSTTVLNLKEIGGRTYAVAGDFSTQKTLSVLSEDGTKWQLKLPLGARFKPPVSSPKEMWISSPDGRKHQAFYFPPYGKSPQKLAAKVILLLHGGPHENVSPRLEPLHERLSRMGFGIFAFNYPGSSGRGADYESLLSNAAVQRAAFRSVFDFIREQGVQVLVTWTISSGFALQEFLLSSFESPSGIVDECGGDNSGIRKAAQEKRVDYFGIRGTNDHVEGNVVDFMYRGGHVLFSPTEFERLFIVLDKFLNSLKPWKPGAKS